MLFIHITCSSHVSERNNNKLIVEMVCLTGLQSVIYLLYIFSIGYSSGILQYRCEPGEINKVNIFIERRVNNLTDFNITDDTVCTKADNKSYISLTACPVNTDITVTLAKPEKGDGLLKIQDVHSYKLHCKRDDKPVTQMVAVTITVKPPSPSTQTQNTFGRTEWVPTLSMTVSKSTLVIGEKASLMISSNEDLKSTISALKCTASSTSPGHTHVIWKSDDCNLVDSQLFGVAKWTNNTKQISHSFEAFRFNDNHDVQITCTVKICPKGKESSCPLACTHKGTPTTAAPTTSTATPNLKPKTTTHARRRRRAAQSETTKVLQTTFRVSDHLQDQNTNSGTNFGTNSGTCKGSFLATSAISAVVLFYTVLL